MSKTTAKDPKAEAQAPVTDLLTTARQAIELAKKKGAQEVSARAYRAREVETKFRDGKLEQVHEATTRGLGLSLYVDGRYSAVNTSDLRPEALDTFIGDSIALARALAKDPFRALPDPGLYQGQAAIDLQVEDAAYAKVTADDRRRLVKEAEAAARTVKGHEAILSVTSSFSDTLAESWLVTSNGFSGRKRDTAFWIGADVSVKDQDGRRPEDYSYAGSRFYGQIPDAASVGREAATRAISRLGSKKAPSEVLTMAIDARAAGRMVSFLMGPLSGGALQQKRSFLEGKLGQAVGSDKLTIKDEPHLVRGFGSRLYDGEGLAAKPMSVFEGGVLKTYYIDTYYGKKLGVAPTTGGMSNLVWKLGSGNREALLQQLGEGILVTGFLGGNSNGTTGDFSLGVQGFRVRKGQVAEPVAEMNISGNHLDFWKKLAGVGNDPYPYSSMRTPTLVFEGVQFAGS